MKKYDISLLLKVLDSKLVAAYEKINLPNGVKLVDVNEDYNKYWKQSESWLVSVFDWINATLFVVTIISLALFCIKSIFTGFDSATFFIAILVGLFGTINFYINKRKQSIEKELSATRTMLRELHESIPGYDCREIFCGIYDESIIWQYFIRMAMEKIASEKSLDLAMSYKKRNRDAVVNVNRFGARWLLTDTRFNNEWEKLKKFGLEFERGEIFAAAQEQLSKLPA